VIDALKVEIGTKLRLKDGSIVEVAENPGNGIWLFCNYISSSDEAKVGLSDEPIYAEEFVAVAE
jgi:hypothetical protein